MAFAAEANACHPVHVDLREGARGHAFQSNFLDDFAAQPSGHFMILPAGIGVAAVHDQSRRPGVSVRKEHGVLVAFRAECLRRIGNRNRVDRAVLHRVVLIYHAGVKPVGVADSVVQPPDDVVLVQKLRAVLPLSTIRGPAEQIGTRASEILDRMMTGGAPPPALTELAPQQIVTRQSTDTFAVSDPVPVNALRFARDHAAGRVHVRDLARAAAVSRSVLERRFRDSLRRTPASEIRRIRVDCAVRLLRETTLSVPEIAHASGFGSPEYLATTISRRSARLRAICGGA